jgi:hypothetical protein
MTSVVRLIIGVTVSQSSVGDPRNHTNQHEMKICFASFRVNSWIGFAYLSF